MRVQTFVFIERLNRDPPPHAGTNNLSRQNARLRANHGAALHTDVIAETHLAANYAIIFNCHSAADAGLRGNHNSLANVAVMTDVDQVVDLRAPADPRAAQSRAIDAGVHAQLNIIFNDHRADLWKLVIAHVAAHVPEPIGADYYAGMKNDPATNRHAVFEKYVWMNHAIAADCNVVANLCTGADLGP